MCCGVCLVLWGFVVCGPMNGERCVGTNVRGVRCGRWPIKGGSVCPKHGGGAPQVRRKAAERVARVEAERVAGVAVRRLGLDLGGVFEVREPRVVLLDALAAAYGDLRVWGVLVSELGEGELSVETVHMTGNRTGESKRHVYVQCWEDAQLRVARIAAQCVKARVSEDEAAAARRRGVVFGEALRVVVSLLGHSPADPLVRSAMRKGLLLGAGSALPVVEHEADGGV